MTELIFIEGVSGIGKSTMVRMLTEELRTEGYRVQPYVEFDFTNPIDFYCTAYLTVSEYDALCKAYPDDADTIRKYTIPAGDVRLVRYYNEDTPLFEQPLRDELVRHEFCYHPAHLVSLEDYTEAYRHVWEDFADGIDDTFDYILFDGSLLHHPINDMMRNYRITGEQAVPHVTTLLRALGGRKRRIFYLETAGIRAQLTRAHLDRKQDIPTDEEVDFWETRHRNDRIVLAHLAENCTVYDVSAGNWNAVRDEIRETLMKAEPCGGER